MDVVELTQQLVQIDSQNPPGNEKGVARLVFDFLEDKGFSPELVKTGENRFNVVAGLGSGPDGLMLNGHMDTVPIGEGWTVEPLGGTVKAGRLYGRGSNDMKGGIAAVLKAVEGLAREKLKRKLLLTFVADEEVGGKFGTNWLIKNRPELFKGVNHGVVAEPSGMHLRIAQKGFFHFRVKFKGKAAHGSVPELGDNAILKASDFIQETKKLAQEIAKVKDELLGPGTINIGKIAGGVKVNIVPDRCEVEVDRRIVPPENAEAAKKQFEKVLERLGHKAEIEPMRVARNPIKISEGSRIVKEILALWPSAKLKSFSGYTELEKYSRDMSVECVAFGPGSGRTAHSVDEYTEIGQLKAAVGVFEKLVRKWCL